MLKPPNYSPLGADLTAAAMLSLASSLESHSSYHSIERGEEKRSGEGGEESVVKGESIVGVEARRKQEE